ncbi:hypothetical protein ALC62_06518 [Cyphomyrmex costatus]|uniref:Uncharacterized protein n=1 Tax=Cyphomyrmex costatus TaxID=456900 RepID=A0A195CPQ3_9HYME|nr:hypothetical protein ALC62_06518 [Cyphomyrmex costatus]
MKIIGTIEQIEQIHLESSPWLSRLAVRESRLPSDIPHIPILIEDIPRYTSLSDYTKNCIQTIQTIGEILPITARVAHLRSISSDREARVTLSLEELPVHALYSKDSKGRHLFIWEKFSIFKIFGMLEQKNNEVVMTAHKLLRVQDIRGSLNTLSLLSSAVRPMHYQ